MKSKIIEFFSDLKKRIKNNWKILLVGVVILGIVIFINNIFDYSSYNTSICYNTQIEGGRTPSIEKGIVVKQNFISQKNNLYRIGIYSLMPGISTNSNVNVKVIELDNKEEIFNQDIFLATLKDNDYFEFNIANQPNSKGKEYQIIITGIDGDNLNSVQFPYSTEKSDYLTGSYVENDSVENNLLIKVTFSNMMNLKKLILIYFVIFISIIIISLYGFEKNNMKNNIKYFLFLMFFAILTIILIKVNFKMNNNEYLSVLKSNLGIITLMLVIILGTIYFILFKNIFEKEIKIEKVFLMVVIPIGLIYLFVTPFGKVPDEITHACKAIDLASGNFITQADENGVAKIEYSSNLKNIFSLDNKNYDDYFDSITENSNEIEYYEFSNMALYSPICHLSQAFGIVLATILNLPLIAKLYLARICNFIVSIILIYFAIKYIPFKKIVILIITILPITMQEITSLSSDALTIAISIFYVSYVLNLKYNDDIKKIKKKEWLILIISSIIVSLSKIVYLPLCLLMFIIPKDKFVTLKEKMIKLGILFISIAILNLLWMGFSSRFLIEYNIGVNSKEQVIFILKNPISYFFICFKTLGIYFKEWWMGLIGNDLGIYGLYTFDISYIYSFFIGVILIMSLISKEENMPKIDNVTKVMALIIFLAIIVLIFTSLYVQFNKVQNMQIIGIQARYFLPVLILIPLILNNNLVNIKLTKGKYKYLFIFIIFFSIHTISYIIKYYLV